MPAPSARESQTLPLVLVRPQPASAIAQIPHWPLLALDRDLYPFAPRLHPLKAILAKPGSGPGRTAYATAPYGEGPRHEL